MRFGLPGGRGPVGSGPGTVLGLTTTAGSLGYQRLWFAGSRPPLGGNSPLPVQEETVALFAEHVMTGLERAGTSVPRQ